MPNLNRTLLYYIYIFINTSNILHIHLTFIYIYTYIQKFLLIYTKKKMNKEQKEISPAITNGT